MQNYILIALGGALGSVSRYWLSGFVAQRYGEVFPLGTLVVNITGSFVIESIFQIPGLGMHFVNSSLNADYTLVVGLALLYAALLIVLNLVVDLAYGWLDPRVELA